jgi:hypothetical protein
VAAPTVLITTTHVDGVVVGVCCVLSSVIRIWWTTYSRLRLFPGAAPKLAWLGFSAFGAVRPAALPIVYQLVAAMSESTARPMELVFTMALNRCI